MKLHIYTLELHDPAFIHQHVVDAWAVQHADSSTKPIAIVFGLVGLYLYLEKNLTGRQVQRVHMQLARRRRVWVAPAIPPRHATLGVADVLAAAPGSAREAAIQRWCEAVWLDWRSSRGFIAALLQSELD